MADDDPDEHQVGYKRPPRRTQFRPGKSGNPRGRPKQVHNVITDLRDELNEYTTVREGGCELRTTKQRAIIKAMVAAAIKGNMRAAHDLVAFCTRVLPSDDQTEASNMAPTEDLEILAAFVERERKRLLKRRPKADRVQEDQQTEEDETHEEDD
jgi:hypothetical protein